MSTSSPNDSSVSEQGIVIAGTGDKLTVLDFILYFYFIVCHTLVCGFRHTVILKILDSFYQ